MSPEVVLRAFSGALVTLQVIGYLWLVWIFFTRTSVTFADVIAIAAYSLAGLNGVVLVVDLVLLRSKRRAPLVGASMMLTAPAFVAAAAAFVLL